MEAEGLRFEASGWGLEIRVFYEVIDRESPITGVWVLDWVIYNRIINTFLAKLERWTREPPADCSRKIVRQTGLTTQ